MSLIDYVTQVQFEFGAIRLLKQECERVGMTVAVFDQTPSNPTEAAVLAATEADYRSVLAQSM